MVLGFSFSALSVLEWNGRLSYKLTIKLKAPMKHGNCLKKILICCKFTHWFVHRNITIYGGPLALDFIHRYFQFWEHLKVQVFKILSLCFYSTQSTAWMLWEHKTHTTSSVSPQMARCVPGPSICCLNLRIGRLRQENLLYLLRISVSGIKSWWDRSG